jgi:hypothetical protein
MSDEFNTTPDPEPAEAERSNPGQAETDSENSWREVGHQFEALGATLAQAFRSTWVRVESNSDAQQVKAGLESLLRDVGKAVEDAAATPEAQKLKEDAKRTAESLRIAGEQSVQESRPQIISALRQVNEELSKLIDKVENKP